MTKKTLSLAQLQQGFINELTDIKNENFRSQIKGNNVNSNIEQLLAIYRNNHRGGRLSALSNIYPITLQIIGKENFSPIALKYIDQNTSNDWDLNTNGGDFNCFLAKTINNNEALNELFYLPELAYLEYLLHSSYYADNPISQEIKEQSPEQLFFIKSPSLFLFNSTLPIYQIWENNKKGDGELAVKKNKETYFHVIYREHYQVIVKEVDELTFTLLNDAFNGHSLLNLITKHGETVLSTMPNLIEKKWLSLTNSP